MQLVSTFADVYLKDVSAPLESICYSGPHAWNIKENEIKQARQKSKTKRKKEKTTTTNKQTNKQKKKKKNNKKNKNKTKQKTTTNKQNN